jgi:hypothetical protein
MEGGAVNAAIEEMGSNGRERCEGIEEEVR